MDEVWFRPRARTMTLLGEELIKDDLTALSEIVKNSFDADASLVRIEISNEGRGFVRVVDDGHGMTRNTVEHAWLEPATNWKAERVQGKKGRSPIGGRVFLGEKGVGRFACHRIAEELHMSTRACSLDALRALENTETSLHINWNWFKDDSKYLDEIKIPLQSEAPSRFLDMSGTELLMVGLRKPWTAEKTEVLAPILVRLKNPYGLVQDVKNNIEFKLSVDGMEIPLEDDLLALTYRADHRLTGTVDSAGVFHGKFNDKDLDEKLNVKFANGTGASCGALRVDFHVYERSTYTSMRKQEPVVTRLLEQYSGVSVYRDGFRVLPYGEKGNDWLMLDARRISRIAVRLSNSQIQGYIGITADENPMLIDKTNREGLIENEAYFDLKELVLGVVKLIENERIRINAKSKVGRPKDPVMNQFQTVSRVVQKAPEEVKNEVQQLKQLYVTEKKQTQERFGNLAQLSGVGMAVERTSHEFGHFLRDIRKGLTELAEIVGDNERANKIISQLHHYVGALNREVRLIAPLTRASRLKVEEVDASAVIRKTSQFFEYALSKSGIKFEVEETAPLTIEENEGVLMQVFINLFDNAIYWLNETQGEQPFIVVTVDGQERTVSIQDNGPGILAADVDMIFEPLFSKKRNGIGMGLYIVEDLLHMRGHSIRLKPSTTGANFVIHFGGRGREN